MCAGSGRYLLLIGFLLTLHQICYSAPANFSTEFEKTCTIKITNGVNLEKFVSKRTGFTFLLMDRKGPMVDVDLTVATEPAGVFGIPYVLNPMILKVGTESRPSYGSLYPLAKKLLTVKYSASAAQKSSTYRAEVVGSDGFPKFLKEFMDQIAHPVFTDSAFKTDVHHVTGEGEDSGLAYNVVSRIKYLPSLLMNNLINSELYPGEKGYIVNLEETLKHMTELTLLEVQSFHRKSYRPENMQLFVVGHVDHEELFAVVHDFEEKILSKDYYYDLAFMKLDLESPPSHLDHNVHKEILVPESQEEQMSIGFRLNDHSGTTVLATEALMKYLVDEVTSHLISPACNNRTSKSDVSEDSEASFIIHFDACSSSQSLVEPWLNSTLDSLANATNAFPFSAVGEKLLAKKSYFEKDSALHDAVFEFGVHGSSSCEDLDNRIHESDLLNELVEKPEQYWRDLAIQIMNTPKVFITGVHSDSDDTSPSAHSMRIQERREKLGEEDFLKLEEELQAAKKIKEQPVPHSLIEETKIPHLNEIPFHHLDSYSNIKSINNEETSFNSSAPHFDIANFPYKFIVDDVESSNVKLFAIFDTSNLSKLQTEFIPYIWYLLENSQLHESEEESKFFVLIYEKLAGTHLVTEEAIYIETQEVDPEHYQEKVSELYDTMYNFNFTASRDTVEYFLTEMKLFMDKLKTEDFLTAFDQLYPQTLEMHGISPVEYLRRSVLPPHETAYFSLENSVEDFTQELHELLTILTSPERVTFYMATNLNNLAEITDINAPWERFLKRDSAKTDLNLHVVREGLSEETDNHVGCFGPEKLGLRRITSSVYKDDKTTEEEIDNTIDHSEESEESEEENEDTCSPTAYVHGIHADWFSRSNIQIVAESIRGDMHEDIAALLTTIEYFKQKEGPLYGEIMALAESFDVRSTARSVYKTDNDGTLSIEVKGAPHPENVYYEISNLFSGFLNGSQEFDECLVNLAKSKAIASSIAKEKTLEDAIKISLQSYFQIAVESKELMPLFEKVTVADVQRVFEKYFKRLITPEESFTLILCPVIEDRGIEAEMNKLGGRAVSTTGAFLWTQLSYHNFNLV